MSGLVVWGTLWLSLGWDSRCIPYVMTVTLPTALRPAVQSVSIAVWTSGSSVFTLLLQHPLFLLASVSPQEQLCQVLPMAPPSSPVCQSRLDSTMNITECTETVMQAVLSGLSLLLESRFFFSLEPDPWEEFHHSYHSDFSAFSRCTGFLL